MRGLKKILYNVFIFLIFIISLPLQILIALGIASASGFPVFFSQRRVGENNQPFVLYKFRTMIMEADRIQKRYRSRNEATGPVFKIRNDPRFTRLGRFLSHTGLDELPQLWNVLKGDMALFGPRPLPIAEAKKLKSWQQQRHVITPGIISPWILEGYHRTSFDDWMKSDIAYSKKKSFFYDLKLFGATVSFMIRLLHRELFV